MAEDAVDDPWRRSAAGRSLFECDFQFVASITATFVDARGLTGWPNKRAGEQIRQRWMVVPIGNQAAEQIGSAQEGAVWRCRAAEHDVVAAAGACVRAVE